MSWESHQVEYAPSWLWMTRPQVSMRLVVTKKWASVQQADGQTKFTLIWSRQKICSSSSSLNVVTCQDEGQTFTFAPDGKVNLYQNKRRKRNVNRNYQQVFCCLFHQKISPVLVFLWAFSVQWHTLVVKWLLWFLKKEWRLTPSIVQTLTCKNLLNLKLVSAWKGGSMPSN